VEIDWIHRHWQIAMQGSTSSQLNVWMQVLQPQSALQSWYCNQQVPQTCGGSFGTAGAGLVVTAAVAKMRAAIAKSFLGIFPPHDLEGCST
jgi:hypothetical protein